MTPARRIATFLDCGWRSVLAVSARRVHRRLRRRGQGPRRRRPDEHRGSRHRPVDGSTPVTAPDPTGLAVAERTRPGDRDRRARQRPALLHPRQRQPGRPGRDAAGVDAGSALEDDTQDGGAHFLEHMLFNGTEEFPENELIAVLRSFGAGFGADINAYTSYDETVYQLTMPTDDPDGGRHRPRRARTVAVGCDDRPGTGRSRTGRGPRRVAWFRSHVRTAASSTRSRSCSSPARRTRTRIPIGTDAAIADDRCRTAPGVLRRLVPTRQRSGRRGRRHRHRARSRRASSIGSDRSWRGVTSPARPELTVEPSSDAAGVDPRRPRRGRGVRAGHVAAHRVADAESVEADYQNLDPRLDGVRHDRHPTRQRRTARRGAVRRCTGRLERVRPQPRCARDHRVGRRRRARSVHAGGVRRVRAGPPVRVLPGRGRPGGRVVPHVGAVDLRRARVAPGR